MSKAAHATAQEAAPGGRREARRLAVTLILLLLLAGAAALVAFGESGVVGAGAAPAAPAGTPGPGQPVLFGSGSPAATQVFTIPLGDNGIGIWDGTDGLYGFAVTADGSFWAGDWTKGGTQDGGRLLHYSASGILLGIVPAPGDRQSRGSINGLQAWGSDLWAIVNRSLVRLAPDGAVRANYPLPDQLDGQAVAPGSFKPAEQAGLSFLLGPQGEVLLLPDVPDTRVARLVDPAGRLAPLRAGADGQTDLATTPAFPGRSRTFGAQVVAPRTGRILAGTAPITLTVAFSLTGLHIFHVNPDDSFYVLVEETFDQPAGVYSTILHYRADGVLLAHGRLPLAGRFAAISRRLAVGPDGAVYALVGGQYGPNPDRAIHVERVTFYPPGVALPAPLVPTPTPGPPPPTATPALTFDDLLAQAPLIVEVAIPLTAGAGPPALTPGQATAQSLVRENVTVQRWLRKPPGRHGAGLGLLLPAAQDQRSRAGAGRAILFLRPVQNMVGYLYAAEARLYEITGDAGLIPIRAGRLVSPALPAFDGQPESALTDALLRRAAPPAPDPPDPVADIAALTHQADQILEGEIADVYGGTGAGTGYAVRVRRWLKKPAGVHTDASYFWTDRGVNGNEDSARVGLGSGHFVFFLAGPVSDPYGREPHILELFSIRDGVIDYADVSRYWGWPLERFVATIRMALARPAPPLSDGQGLPDDPSVEIAFPPAPRWSRVSCPQGDGIPAFSECWAGTGAAITVSVGVEAPYPGAQAQVDVLQGTDYTQRTQDTRGRPRHDQGFTAPFVGPLRVAALAGTRITLAPREARFSSVRLVLDLAAGRWLAPSEDWPWTWHAGACGTIPNTNAIAPVDCWADAATDALTRVQAGAAPDAPAQGLLRVVQGSAADIAAGLEVAAVYPTPRQLGPVRIAGITGPWVSLVPVDPHWVATTFVFDLATRRWLPAPTTSSWQLAATRCAALGVGEAAGAGCWSGLVNGRRLSLVTLPGGDFAIGETGPAFHAASTYSAPLPFGSVRVVAVPDGRLVLAPLNPRFADLRLVYDLVTQRWLVPALGTDIYGPLECPATPPGLQTCRTAIVRGAALTLGAGSAVASAEPAQGILIVSPGLTIDPGAPATRIYMTPRVRGAVQIASLHDTQVTLVTADGQAHFVFDLATRQWVSPPGGSSDP